MVKRVIFVIYLHCCIVYAHYDEMCPSNQLRRLRSNLICLSEEKYTCLLDFVKSIYKESCSGPRTEPPGDKTVVNSGNFDTKPCFQDRFQPFPFVTSQGYDCIFKKTVCSDEGQIVNYNGNSRKDRNCRCDYTRSFSFLSPSRKNRCSCDPTMEDCSCFMKHCDKGEILSQDYHCINKESSYGKCVCAEIEITQTTVGTQRDVKGVNIRKPNTIGTVFLTEIRMAAITSTALTGTLIVVFILMFRVLCTQKYIIKKLVIGKDLPCQSQISQTSSSKYSSQKDHTTTPDRTESNTQTETCFQSSSDGNQLGVRSPDLDEYLVRSPNRKKRHAEDSSNRKRLQSRQRETL